MAGAAHAPMEPHAAVAEWEDGRLTLWSGTQTPFNVRSDLAGCFGLPEDGDPGHRPGRWAARSAPRPSCGWRRSSPLSPARPAGPSRRCSTAARSSSRSTATRPWCAVRIGARRDGTLTAKEVDCWADTGAYADCGPGVATKMGYAGVGPYRIPHVRVDSQAIYTNLPPNGAFRGYGATQSVWASERTMDLLARELEMSPLELRRINLLRRRRRRSPPARSCTTCTSRSASRPPPTPSATRPTRAARACACCSRACRRRAAPRSRSSARRSATSCAAPRPRWARTCGSRSA